MSEVVEQCQRWLAMHNNPVFKDGLYYWLGMAHLQLSEYPQAIAGFENLLSEFPSAPTRQTARCAKVSAITTNRMLNRLVRL